jgi:hypothetical protein
MPSVTIDRALLEALDALRQIEWSAQGGTKCPRCGRARAYGQHVCSCPIALAFKSARSAGAQVPPPRTDAPGPVELVRPIGQVGLREITLEQWARWRWVDVTAGGDRERTFLAIAAREPAEVADALATYKALRAEAPGLFPHDNAHP